MWKCLLHAWDVWSWLQQQVRTENIILPFIFPVNLWNKWQEEQFAQITLALIWLFYIWPSPCYCLGERVWEGGQGCGGVTVAHPRPYVAHSAAKRVNVYPLPQLRVLMCGSACVKKMWTSSVLVQRHRLKPSALFVSTTPSLHFSVSSSVQSRSWRKRSRKTELMGKVRWTRFRTTGIFFPLVQKGKQQTDTQEHTPSNHFHTAVSY